MKKLYLIRNPINFQGEKYLKNNKNYFEGWYFKQTNKKNCISFIPGISINKNDKKAFIQVITNKSSYFIDYDITEFKYNLKPFYVMIGNNYFSEDFVRLDIKDDNLVVCGEIKYSNSKNINTSWFNPNIMGPFSYVPFMECNHAIISMKNKVNGKIFINDNKIEFNDGIGYIEKDWGISFPKTYIWCQGNNFKKSNASFMLSIADIPFKFINFKGIICSLIVDNKEYKFTTYNNSKLLKYEVDDKKTKIILKKGNYLLKIKFSNSDSFKLIAPVMGQMNKDILESISAVISVTLKYKNKVIFKDTIYNCGLEIVT